MEKRPEMRYHSPHESKVFCSDRIDGPGGRQAIRAYPPLPSAPRLRRQDSRPKGRRNLADRSYLPSEVFQGTTEARPEAQPLKNLLDTLFRIGYNITAPRRLLCGMGQCLLAQLYNNTTAFHLTSYSIGLRQRRWRWLCE